MEPALIRLLRNASDYAGLCSSFYGKDCATGLDQLMGNHIVITVNLVKAIKAGNGKAARAAEKLWYENADQFAGFLSRMKPRGSFMQTRAMCHEYLALVKAAAGAALNRDYAGSGAIFNQIAGKAFLMTDDFATGWSTPLGLGDDQAPAQPVNGSALPAGYVVLDRKTGAVTGDGAPKEILLIGQKTDVNSDYADDLRIVVRDGASRKVITVGLPDIGGYNSKLFIGDFSGDKVADVLVTVPSGGSGGYVAHRIVTFVGEPKIIFGEKENDGIVATGHFIDGFKVELTEESTKRTAIIDQSAKKDIYIQAGLYDEHGKLLRQQSVSVSPLGGLDPIDVEPDGTYELRGVQRVIGIYNADTVGYLYSIWKYENQKWVAKQIEVSSVILEYGR